MHSGHLRFDLNFLFQNSGIRSLYNKPLFTFLPVLELAEVWIFSSWKRNRIPRASASQCGLLNCSLLPTYSKIWQTSVCGLVQTFPCPVTPCSVPRSDLFLLLLPHPCTTLGGDPVTWRQLVTFLEVLWEEDRFGLKQVTVESDFFLSFCFYKECQRHSLTIWVIHFRSFTVMPHRKFESP